MASNNPYDFGDPIGSFYQGYQMSKIPNQLRQEQQMNALKQAYMQQQMQYEPQMNAAKMQQLKLQNQGLGITNQIDAQKLKAAKMDADRRKAFMTMLQVGNSGSSTSQPTSIYAPSSPMVGNLPPSVMPPINNNAPYGQASPNPMLMNGGLQPGQQPAQAVNPQLPGSPMNAPQQQTPNSNQSQLDQLDALYMNPQTRGQYGDLWKEYAPNAKQQIFNDPSTGQLVVATTLPSGRIDVKTQQAGPTAEETAFNKEIGKSNAKQYDTISTQQANISQSSIALDGVIQALQDPELKRIVGPTGQSFTTKLFGSSADKKKLGDFEAYSGKIWQDAMQSLRGLGSASNADSESIQRMKPNENDSYDVIYGKTMALKQTAELLSQRNKVYFDLMKQPGMKSQEALRMAQNMVSMDKIKPQIDDMMKGNIWVQFPDGQVKTVKASEVSNYTNPNIGGRIYGQ